MGRNLTFGTLGGKSRTTLATEEVKSQTSCTGSWWRRNGPHTQLHDIGILVTSVFASLGFLSALVGILVSFDGIPIFDHSAVTLNTFVAILSAASKATIIYAVSHAIGQWKWIAFSNQRRRLLDFERVESASRGPLGSLSLLFNARVERISFVRIGALLSVLAVALDPFAQQLVQYSQVLHFAPTVPWKGTIDIGTDYTKGTEIRLQVSRVMFVEGNSTSLAIGGVPIRADADFSMQSAIMYGIVQPLEAVTQQLNFTCVTGDCNYEVHDSLSVCSACTDLSSQLDRAEVDGGLRLNISLDTSSPGVTATDHPVLRYNLSNGLYLDNSVSLTMLGTTNQSKTIAHQDIDTLIWSQSVIRHRGIDPSHLETNDASPHVEATECSLYYCIKTYNSTVRHGKLIQEVTINRTAVRQPDSWGLIQDPRNQPDDLTASRRESLAFHPRFSYLKRYDLILGDTQIAHGQQIPVGYNISQAAVNGISSFMQQTFSSCTLLANCNETIEPVSDNWTPINGFYMGKLENTQFAPSVAQALWESANISDTFASIAASMSNAIRMAEGRNALRPHTEMGVMQTLYKVEWRWIALHSFVDIVGVLFVVVTLFRSWGYIPLWGSSTLAVLARGEAVTEVFAGTETLDEMQARARGVSVVLLDGRMKDVEVDMEVDDLLMHDEDPGMNHTQPYAPHGPPGLTYQRQ